MNINLLREIIVRRRLDQLTFHYSFFFHSLHSNTYALLQSNMFALLIWTSNSIHHDQFTRESDWSRFKPRVICVSDKWARCVKCLEIMIRRTSKSERRQPLLFWPLRPMSRNQRRSPPQGPVTLPPNLWLMTASPPLRHRVGLDVLLRSSNP